MKSQELKKKLDKVKKERRENLTEKEKQEIEIKLETKYYDLLEKPLISEHRLDKNNEGIWNTGGFWEYILPFEELQKLKKEREYEREIEILKKELLKTIKKEDYRRARNEKHINRPLACKIVRCKPTIRKFHYYLNNDPFFKNKDLSDEDISRMEGYIKEIHKRMYKLNLYLSPKVVVGLVHYWSSSFERHIYERYTFVSISSIEKYSKIFNLGFNKSIYKIEGVGIRIVKHLTDHGYKTIKELSQASVEELIKINLIGKFKARKLIEGAKRILEKE